MATIEGRNPVIEAIKNDREIDKIMIANSAKEGSIKKIIGMAKEKNIVILYYIFFFQFVEKPPVKKAEGFCLLVVDKV